MSHSLIGADHRAHCKIVGVALVSAMSLVMLAATAWRGETGAPAAQMQSSGPVLKAGGPAISATAGAPIIR
jgi:hypothetical protein